jgi:hypothetical protein
MPRMSLNSKTIARNFCKWLYEDPSARYRRIFAQNLCAEKIQVIENKRIGSLGKIRTSNPSVNSGRDGKSKCRVWCRLQKNGAIFPALVAPNAAPKSTVDDRAISAEMARL